MAQGHAGDRPVIEVLVCAAADALNKPMDGMIRGIRMAQTIVQKFKEMSASAKTDVDDEDIEEEAEIMAEKKK